MNELKLFPILIVVLAALVTYGAGFASNKIAEDDPEKQRKIKLILKSAGLVLILVAIFLIMYL